MNDLLVISKYRIVQFLKITLSLPKRLKTFKTDFQDLLHFKNGKSCKFFQKHKTLKIILQLITYLYLL